MNSFQNYFLRHSINFIALSLIFLSFEAQLFILFQFESKRRFQFSEFSYSRHQLDSIVTFASDTLRRWFQIHWKAESRGFRSVPFSLNLGITSESYRRIELKSGFVIFGPKEAIFWRIDGRISLFLTNLESFWCFYSIRSYLSLVMSKFDKNGTDGKPWLSAFDRVLN